MTEPANYNGGWMSCTGCHETNDGQETGDYDYSKYFGCYVGSGCNECGGIGVIWHQTPSDSDIKMMLDNAVLTPAASDGVESWRCFHCGEVFTDRLRAKEHFGFDECADPACRIKMGAERSLLSALRAAEDDAAAAWAAIHNESTEAAKAYQAQSGRHRAQLVAMEELGYERGLADGRADIMETMSSLLKRAAGYIAEERENLFGSLQVNGKIDITDEIDQGAKETIDEYDSWLEQAKPLIVDTTSLDPKDAARFYHLFLSASLRKIASLDDGRKAAIVSRYSKPQAVAVGNVDPPGPIDAEAAFLLDRLEDFVMKLQDDDIGRDFHGHVCPSMARLHAIIAPPMAPKPEVKPVAWRWRWKDSDSWVLAQYEPEAHSHRIVVPLVEVSP